MNEQEQFEQALDKALAQPNTAQNRAELPPELTDLVATRSKLDVLKAVPELPQQAVASTRKEFLQAARMLKAQSGSPSLLQRLGALFSPTGGAQKRLSTRLSRATLATGLVVVLMGASVGSAMAAAPTSPLYGLKTAIEDVRMSLTSDPGQRAQLALSLALERTQEAEQMAQSGQTTDVSVVQRLQQQLNLALENATRMGQQEQAQFLTQLFSQIETQLKNLATVKAETPAMNQETLRSMEQMWQQTQAQAELSYRDSPAVLPVTPLPLQTTKTPEPQAKLTPFPGDNGLNRAAEAISASLQLRHEITVELPITATVHMQGKPTELPPTVMPVQEQQNRPTDLPPTVMPAQEQQNKPTALPIPTAVQQQGSGNGGTVTEPTTLPIKPAATQQPASTPVPPVATVRPGSGPGPLPTAPAGQGTGHGG